MVMRLDAAHVERVRLEERAYLRLLSGMSGLRLRYAPEYGGRTDGETITVDPEYLLPGDPALTQAAERCGIAADQIRAADPLWRLFLRGVELHELFHVLYSRFDSIEKLKADPRARTTKRASALLLLGNLVEDCFVNNAGTTEFGGCKPILRFLNETVLMRTDREAKPIKNGEEYDFSDFIDHAYLEFKNGKAVGVPHELYRAARPHMLEATLCASAKRRLSLVRDIFDLIDRYGGLGESKRSRVGISPEAASPRTAARRASVRPLYDGADDGGVPLLFETQLFGERHFEAFVDHEDRTYDGVLLVVYAGAPPENGSQALTQTLDRLNDEAEQARLKVKTYNADADNLTDLCIFVQKKMQALTHAESVKKAVVFSQEPETEAAVRRLKRAGIDATFLSL